MPRTVPIEEQKLYEHHSRFTVSTGGRIEAYARQHQITISEAVRILLGRGLELSESVSKND